MLEAPSLIFLLLLASIYAAIFQVLKGRQLRHLAVYWLASTLGFVAGDLAGEMLELLPWTLGPIHILEATAGSFLFLIGIHWLIGEKATP
jgi:hypothetical protein